MYQPETKGVAFVNVVIAPLNQARALREFKLSHAQRQMRRLWINCTFGLICKEGVFEEWIKWNMWHNIETETFPEFSTIRPHQLVGLHPVKERRVRAQTIMNEWVIQYVFIRCSQGEEYSDKETPISYSAAIGALLTGAYFQLTVSLWNQQEVQVSCVCVCICESDHLQVHFSCPG